MSASESSERMPMVRLVLLRLEGAFEAGEEALGQRCGCDLAADGGNHLGEVCAGRGVGEHHDAAPTVLAWIWLGPSVSLISAICARRRPSRWGPIRDRRAASWCACFREPHGHVEAAVAIGDANARPFESRLNCSITAAGCTP